MNTTFTKESLVEWIKDLIEAAKDDKSFSIAWFKGTENSPLSIIGGWMPGFSEDYSNIFYISKTEPKYAMSIKIVDNTDSFAYPDYETMDMPINKLGEVEDTCVPLEWDDNPELVAEFYIHEWERLMAMYTTGESEQEHEYEKEFEYDSPMLV